ncbi:hypothetical protein PENSPDRAFT_672435, partial [Peniophora sp. CONT]
CLGGYLVHLNTLCWLQPLATKQIDSHGPKFNNEDVMDGGDEEDTAAFTNKHLKQDKASDEKQSGKVEQRTAARTFNKSRNPISAPIPKNKDTMETNTESDLCMSRAKGKAKEQVAKVEDQPMDIHKMSVCWIHEQPREQIPIPKGNGCGRQYKRVARWSSTEGGWEENWPEAIVDGFGTFEGDFGSTSDFRETNKGNVPSCGMCNSRKVREHNDVSDDEALPKVRTTQIVNISEDENINEEQAPSKKPCQQKQKQQPSQKTQRRPDAPQPKLKQQAKISRQSSFYQQNSTTYCSQNTPDDSEPCGSTPADVEATNNQPKKKRCHTPRINNAAQTTSVEDLRENKKKVPPSARIVYDNNGKLTSLVHHAPATKETPFPPVTAEGHKLQVKSLGGVSLGMAVKGITKYKDIAERIKKEGADFLSATGEYIWDCRVIFCSKGSSNARKLVGRAFGLDNLKVKCLMRAINTLLKNTNFIFWSVLQPASDDSNYPRMVYSIPVEFKNNAYASDTFPPEKRTKPATSDSSLRTLSLFMLADVTMLIHFALLDYQNKKPRQSEDTTMRRLYDTRLQKSRE